MQTARSSDVHPLAREFAQTNAQGPSGHLAVAGGKLTQARVKKEEANPELIRCEPFGEIAQKDQKVPVKHEGPGRSLVPPLPIFLKKQAPSSDSSDSDDSSSEEEKPRWCKRCRKQLSPKKPKVAKLAKSKAIKSSQMQTERTRNLHREKLARLQSTVHQIYSTLAPEVENQ